MVSLSRFGRTCFSIKNYLSFFLKVDVNGLEKFTGAHLCLPLSLVFQYVYHNSHITERWRTGRRFEDMYPKIIAATTYSNYL